MAKNKFIRCVDCRFRACTLGDAGWNGAEVCLSSDSPFFGQKIMYDDKGYALNDGCENGSPLTFEPGQLSTSLNCIPPGWIIE